jgi:hypothetical protein
MKNLWVFGDSFSHPFESKIVSGPMGRYGSWKGYDPKIYSEFLSKELNINLKTKAINGCSNRTILSQFVNVMDKINDEDIIIINWTEINRHRIIHNNKLFDIVPFETTELVKNLTIPNHAIIEYAVNRIDSFAFYSEINEYIKLIKKSKSNNLIINWTWCYFENPKNEFIEFIDNMDFYGSLETISHETNENIRDWHYSENAHKLLSDIFIEIISNPTERKKYRLETHDPIFRPDINSNSFTIKKLL